MDTSQGQLKQQNKPTSRQGEKQTPPGLPLGDKKKRNMYYEEKIINGVLCFRNIPKGEWIKFSDIELTNEILRLKEKLKELGYQLQFKMYY